MSTFFSPALIRLSLSLIRIILPKNTKSECLLCHIRRRHHRQRNLAFIWLLRIFFLWFCYSVVRFDILLSLFIHFGTLSFHLPSSIASSSSFSFHGVYVCVCAPFSQCQHHILHNVYSVQIAYTLPFSFSHFHVNCRIDCLLLFVI